jgi:death-on-curing protein
MQYLDVEDVKRLHKEMIDAIGGSHGILNLGALESAIAQPQLTFGGEELYPTLEDKAASLGFSLGLNHAFNDGNKRVAHAAIEVFLRLNGFTLSGTEDEHERVFLALAAGELDRQAFTDWVKQHVTLR